MSPFTIYSERLQLIVQQLFCHSRSRIIHGFYWKFNFWNVFIWFGSEPGRERRNERSSSVSCKSLSLRNNWSQRLRGSRREKEACVVKLAGRLSGNAWDITKTPAGNTWAMGRGEKVRGIESENSPGEWQSIIRFTVEIQFRVSQKLGSFAQKT